VVTHEAPVGSIGRSVAAIAAMPETLAPPTALRVVSDRGVEELGWA
jgi:hypothetical protein